MAAVKLYDKLRHLNVNLLGISDCSKKSLSGYLKGFQNLLRRYSYILSWSVANTNIPLDKFVFIDYGGGLGILSLLSREVGLGKVIYNDIQDVRCSDAKIIGETIQSEADYYVHGNIDELINFLKTNSINCDVVASNDVIEHIYDIETFLARLYDISDGSFRVVMASSANPHNPVIRKKLMRQHMEAEHKDREKEWGYNKRDCLSAYFSARKEIISYHTPSLLDSEIERLAKATRGLIEPEIKACVNKYLETGKIPRKPDHPTNTCDPYTGSWTERLMDINHLKRILSDDGFEVDILNGYYGISNNTFNRLIYLFLNFLISALKYKGLIFAPYYIIYAKRN